MIEKDRSLWVYEAGLTVLFIVVAAIAFARTHNFQNSLGFFIKAFLFAQPVIIGAHILDKRRRR
ncbi:MAG TPA: hypothetical protein VGU03_01175 [Frateuria sp.]|uniref:hypothetical protein n=1 Tax=Frateuria sp. TaxID=2211372 RepID=UPI002DF6E72C|nr:hypothetical protein [Frateuria sp.]